MRKSSNATAYPPSLYARTERGNAKAARRARSAGARAVPVRAAASSAQTRTTTKRARAESGSPTKADDEGERCHVTADFYEALLTNSYHPTRQRRSRRGTLTAAAAAAEVAAAAALASPRPVCPPQRAYSLQHAPLQPGQCLPHGTQRKVYTQLSTISTGSNEALW